MRAAKGVGESSISKGKIAYLPTKYICNGVKYQGYKTATKNVQLSVLDFEWNATYLMRRGIQFLPADR